MKAIRTHHWGQPLQVEELARPAAGEGNVLVRVRAAAVNPVDVFAAAGYLQSMLQLPYTPGSDFAGEVAEVGAGVGHVKPGDAVYGFVPFRGGIFAEHAVVTGAEDALKQQSLSREQAEVVPTHARAVASGSLTI